MALVFLKQQLKVSTAAKREKEVLNEYGVDEQ
jgi:hypothetical protein